MFENINIGQSRSDSQGLDIGGTRVCSMWSGKADTKTAYTLKPGYGRPL